MTEPQPPLPQQPWRPADSQPDRQLFAAAVDRAAAATAPRGRSLAPDLARGLMLLLIALANVPWWLWDVERGATSSHALGAEGADLAYQLVSLVVIDGRSYPLFALLFGMGIWQLYSRQSAAGTPMAEAKRLLQRRHWWMLAIGGVHAVLLWFGDIVGAYGLIGLLVTATLLQRSDRVLRTVAWVLGGVLAAVALAGLASGLVLGAGLGDDLAMAAPEELPMPPGEPDYLVFMLSSAQTWLLATAGQVLMLTVPLAVVLGVLAGRAGLLDRPLEHRALLKRIAIVGIAVGWAGGAVAAAQHAGWLLEPSLSWATLGVSSLTGVAGGVGYAALFGLVAARIGSRRGVVTRAIAAVGKRSLSSYLLQSVLFAPVLAAWGLGLGATVGALGAAALAIGVWLVTAIVALVLDLAGRRGPAEALLRRLAYGGRPVAPPTPVA